MPPLVSETYVLHAIALWFVNHATIDKMVISVPHGQQLANVKQREQLKEALAGAGIDKEKLSFESKGPDIEVWEEERIWRVECKGLTGGHPSTLANNFDRALASVVSYYDEPQADAAPDTEPPNLKDLIESLQSPDRPVRLALALPEDKRYQHLIRTNLKPALRRKLDLWLFMVDPKTRNVQYILPEAKL